MCLFVFRVLPRLSSSAEGAVIMLTLGVVPAFLNIFTLPKYQEDPKLSGYRNLDQQDEENNQGCCSALMRACCSPQAKKSMCMILNILSFLVMLSGILFWPIVFFLKDETYMSKEQQQNAKELRITVPISLVLMSLTWWMNFLGRDTKLGPLTEPLNRFRKKVKKSRTKLYLVVSIWRMGMTIVFMIAMLGWHDRDVSRLFDFGDNYGDCQNAIKQEYGDPINSKHIFPVYF